MHRVETRAHGLSRITNDLPCGTVCEGEGEGAPTAAASDDDDDGGDSDGEPARPRPQSHKHPSPPALLAFASLSHYVSFGRSRIYGLIADGEFPKPIKVGKSSRWVRAEIDAWINSQSAQRIGG